MAADVVPTLAFYMPVLMIDENGRTSGSEYNCRFWRSGKTPTIIFDAPAF